MAPLNITNKNISNISEIDKFRMECKVICNRLDDNNQQVTYNKIYVNKRQTRYQTKVSKLLKMETDHNIKVKKEIRSCITSSTSKEKVLQVINKINAFVHIQDNSARYAILEKVAKIKFSSVKSYCQNNSIKCQIDLDRINFNKKSYELITSSKLCKSTLESTLKLKRQFETKPDLTESSSLNSCFINRQNRYNLSHLAETTYTTTLQTKGGKKYYSTEHLEISFPDLEITALPQNDNPNKYITTEQPINFCSNNDTVRQENIDSIDHTGKLQKLIELAADVKNNQLVRSNKEKSENDEVLKEKHKIQEEPKKVSDAQTTNAFHSSNVKQLIPVKVEVAIFENIKPQNKNCITKMNLNETANKEEENNLGEGSNFKLLCVNETSDIPPDTKNYNILLNNLKGKFMISHNLPNKSLNKISLRNNNKFEILSDEKNIGYKNKQSMNFDSDSANIENDITNVVDQFIKNNLEISSDLTEIPVPSQNESTSSSSNNLTPLQHYEFNCDSTPQSTSTPNCKNKETTTNFDNNSDMNLNEILQSCDFNISELTNYNETSEKNFFCNKPLISDYLLDATQAESTEIGTYFQELDLIDMEENSTCDMIQNQSIKSSSSADVVDTSNAHLDDSPSKDDVADIKTSDNNAERNSNRFKLDRTCVSDSKCILRKRRWKSGCSLSLKNDTGEYDIIQQPNNNISVNFNKGIEQNHCLNSFNREADTHKISGNIEILTPSKKNEVTVNKNQNILFPSNESPTNTQTIDEKESILSRLKSFTPVISTKKEVKFPISSSILCTNKVDPPPLLELETNKNDKPPLPRSDTSETFVNNLTKIKEQVFDYRINKNNFVQNWLKKTDSDFHEFKVPLLPEKNVISKARTQAGPSTASLRLPDVTEQVDKADIDDDSQSSSSSDDIISLYATSLVSFINDDKIEQQQLKPNKKHTIASIDNNSAKRRKVHDEREVSHSSNIELTQPSKPIQSENSLNNSKVGVIRKPAVIPLSESIPSVSKPIQSENFLNNSKVEVIRKPAVLPLSESVPSVYDYKHILFPYAICYPFVFDYCNRAACTYKHKMPELYLVQQNMETCNIQDVIGCYNVIRRSPKAFHHFFGAFFEFYSARKNQNMLMHMAMDTIKYFHNKTLLEFLIFELRKLYELPDIFGFLNKNCLIQNDKIYEYFLVSLKQENLLLSNIMLLKEFNKNLYFKSGSTIEILVSECFYTKDIYFINEVNEMLSEMDAKLLFANAQHVKNFVKLIKTIETISPYKILYKLSFIEDETELVPGDEQNNMQYARNGQYQGRPVPGYDANFNNYKYKTPNKVNENIFNYHQPIGAQYNRLYNPRMWKDNNHRRDNRFRNAGNFNIEQNKVEPTTSNCNNNFHNNNKVTVSGETLRRPQFKELDHDKKLNLQPNIERQSTTDLQSNVQGDKKSLKDVTAETHEFKKDTSPGEGPKWQQKWAPSTLSTDDSLSFNTTCIQEYQPAAQNFETEEIQTVGPDPNSNSSDSESSSKCSSESPFSDLTNFSE